MVRIKNLNRGIMETSHSPVPFRYLKVVLISTTSHFQPLHQNTVLVLIYCLSGAGSLGECHCRGFYFAFPTLIALVLQAKGTRCGSVQLPSVSIPVIYRLKNDLQVDLQTQGIHSKSDFGQNSIYLSGPHVSNSASLH